ncbi:hypothetical protein KKF91_18165 [Myxococcota bacterium]|nr:hypothetical protein [Myxococcota bacterium]MBU1432468.1 hypothetical protein [Myxococcota bacterium]MBU1900402.1 hypothetical protein [Myxococcota bacterium]
MDDLIVALLVLAAALVVAYRVTRFLKGRTKCDACTHKCDLVEPPPLIEIDEPPDFKGSRKEATLDPKE